MPSKNKKVNPAAFLAEAPTMLMKGDVKKAYVQWLHAGELTPDDGKTLNISIKMLMPKLRAIRPLWRPISTSDMVTRLPCVNQLTTMISRWKGKLTEVRELYKNVNEVTETSKDDESDEDADDELVQTPELRSSEAELKKMEPIQRPEELPSLGREVDNYDRIEAYADQTYSAEQTLDWKA